jgi:hypothetical protein
LVLRLRRLIVDADVHVGLPHAKYAHHHQPSSYVRQVEYIRRQKKKLKLIKCTTLSTKTQALAAKRNCA